MPTKPSIRFRQANADDIPAMSAIRLAVRENVLLPNNCSTLLLDGCATKAGAMPD